MQKAYRYVTEANPPFAEHSTQVIFVQSDEIAAQVVARLRAVEHLSYDWETTGVNPNVAVGFCLGMSWKPGTAVVWPAQMVRKYRKELTEIFSRPDLVCIAFNAMFDAKFNERIGLPARVDEDPMLMHYMLDERPQHRSLESLTMDYLDAPPYESEMLAKYECTKSEMVKKVPVEVIYEYCGRDADYALRLYLLFNDLLKDKPGPQKAYREVVIPAARAFADIQHYGVWVNRDRLESVTTEYEEILKKLQAELVEIVGDENFNPNSHQQVQGFIWDYLKLKEPELYGRKPRSVDKTTREALLARYPDHPFIVALDKYKATYTNLSRYLWPLTKAIDPDGRIRSSYRLDRTETGRLSTTDPPIHQIPRESNIRSIFGAPPGYVLVQADYSQVEIRMAAHYADDWRLIALLKSGVDFHTKMAAEAFRIPVDQVTKEQRQAAKAVSFGLLYLMGDKKLADSTGLPPEEATAFVQSYKALMPDVQKWIEKTKRQVRERRYVESIFGRRRRFPLITNQNLAKLQREAVNMPVQSAASDLTLCSVIKLHEIFKQEYPEARIVIMVHDSIIVECPAPLAEEIGFLMIKIMSDPPFETNVPFPVEVKIGECWGEGEILTG
jgi:DNA polymerase I - 3'-5' exonuclease and polymerase domains